MKVLVIRCVLMLMVLMPSFASATENMLNGQPVEEMEWDQLMPADFSLESIFKQSDELAMIDDFDPRAQKLLDEMMVAMQSAPVIPELDGKMIKVPGYVVPMESDGLNVTEFFLVPYFGACIHVPPPPSNQIIYVRFEPGTKVENLYDAIWVTGRLKTETVSTDMATSGYSMEAFQIAPYEL
ncbi:DUF3299 domain-containing protein [Neptuniibacter caesariensis]|uniref:Uncharacterized conserved secreted protein n=1 Tax=Neptuniibacter caesariensis TaxID=207954 RepID=A0A7U8C871_NEPCE|nr:DUF3299 domain-containing protein [Neptuniibacter caesariensis]EAR62416.1 Uncharacterized conserved secreted protein [Oceanospirillum sp. MED92] [Neptuniibacter caesariensis]